MLVEPQRDLLEKTLKEISSDTDLHIEGCMTSAKEFDTSIFLDKMRKLIPAT